MLICRVLYSFFCIAHLKQQAKRFTGLKKNTHICQGLARIKGQRVEISLEQIVKSRNSLSSSIMKW